MKSNEKLLIGVFLLSGLMFNFSRLLNFNGAMYCSFLIDISAIMLLLHYFITIKKSFLSIIPLLLTLQVIGHIFRLFHLQGAFLLEAAGIIGSLLFSITLSLNIFKEHKQNAELYYLIAGTIFIQAIFYLNMAAYSSRYGEYFNYLLVGLIGTLKLRKIEKAYWIDKLLNVYLIYGILFILWDTVNLIKG